MKNNNMIFFFMMIMSMLLIVMSNSMLNMWIYLEMNLLSFIFLMINYSNFKTLESSMLYFLIQTIGSILLLLAISMSFYINSMMIIFMLSLMLKLGLSPFHIWIIIMIDKLNWMTIYLMLTFQKLPPLIILNQFNSMNNIMIYLIFMSMMVGSLMGLNYTSLKKILSFSSINQLTWLIMSMYYINKMFKIYFIMYSIMMYITIKSFMIMNIKFIYHIFTKKMSNYMYMFIFFNLMSLGGLPPFMGFYPKLLIIYNFNNSLMMFFMIMFTLFTLFYYLRSIVSIMLINSMKTNLMSKKMSMMSMIKYSTLTNSIMMYLFLMY